MRWLARTRGEQYVEVNYDLFRIPEQAQPCKSSCPDGMRLASHDTVCDPILRKCGVPQFSVSTFPTSSMRWCSHCAMKGQNM